MSFPAVPSGAIGQFTGDQPAIPLPESDWPQIALFLANVKLAPEMVSHPGVIALLSTAKRLFATVLAQKNAVSVTATLETVEGYEEAMAARIATEVVRQLQEAKSE